MAELDRDTGRGSKDNLLRWCLAASSVLMTLLLLEAGLRVHAYMRQHASEVAWQHLGAPPMSPVRHGDVALPQLIRPSSNPKVIYELVPNQAVQFCDQRVTVNALGFRGPAVAPVKPPGTKRIVGLGDSLMFGWGVGDAEYYLALIAERLARQGTGPTVEVINSAVPGYNTVMEVETLKEKLLQFTPDVVIIEYVDNDLDLPNFLDTPLSPASVDHLFLHDFVVARLAGRVWDPTHRLAGAPRDPFRDRRLEGNPDRVPAQYRALVGIEAYRAAMAELKALSVTRRFAVVVFSRAPLPDDVAAVCSALGLPMVSAWPAIERYLTEHGGGRYEESALALSANDPHPSALGHRLMADVLFDYLERTGLP
jgi:lysophospholipase L1-like esterase